MTGADIFQLCLAGGLVLLALKPLWWDGGMKEKVMVTVDQIIAGLS